MTRKVRILIVLFLTFDFKMTRPSRTSFDSLESNSCWRWRPFCGASFPTLERTLFLPNKPGSLKCSNPGTIQIIRDTLGRWGGGVRHSVTKWHKGKGGGLPKCHVTFLQKKLSPIQHFGLFSKVFRTLLLEKIRCHITPGMGYGRFRVWKTVKPKSDPLKTFPETFGTMSSLFASNPGIRKTTLRFQCNPKS